MAPTLGPRRPVGAGTEVGRDEWLAEAARHFAMRDGYLGGFLARPATQRQTDVLAAFVAAGESHARSDLP